jgi:hypothetical protein
MQPVHSIAVRSNPNIAEPVFEQRQDRVTGKSVRNSQCAELSSAQERKAAANGSNPQSAAATGEDGVYFVTSEFRSIPLIEDRNVEPVKADQTEFCSKPQISVAGLGNCWNGILRETLLSSPDILLKLAD